MDDAALLPTASFLDPLIVNRLHVDRQNGTIAYPRKMAMDVPMLTELWKVWHRTTPQFQQLIDKFLQDRNLTMPIADGDDDNDAKRENRTFYFDAALHVRYCVDCGSVHMPKEQIQADLQCFLKRFRQQQEQELQQQQNITDNQQNTTIVSNDFWKGRRFFLTSDTRDVLPWVQEVMPHTRRWWWTDHVGAVVDAP